MAICTIGAVRTTTCYHRHGLNTLHTSSKYSSISLGRSRRDVELGGVANADDDGGVLRRCRNLAAGLILANLKIMSIMKFVIDVGKKRVFVNTGHIISITYLFPHSPMASVPTSLYVRNTYSM